MAEKAASQSAIVEQQEGQEQIRTRKAGKARKTRSARKARRTRKASSAGKARRGGQEANMTQEETIQKYSSMVYRFAFAKTGSRYDAEDIYEEVFLRYLKKMTMYSFK